MHLIEISEQQLKTLKDFMSRVPLRGKEVETFMDLVRALPKTKVDPEVVEGSAPPEV